MYKRQTALYEEATDEKEKKETNLPPLEQGQVLKLRELKSCLLYTSWWRASTISLSSS